MKCPRRLPDPNNVFNLPEEDTWDSRKGVTHCSYCGSVSPNFFMKHVESGGIIVPTDKNYKVYLRVINPNAGKPNILSTANFKAGDDYIEVMESNWQTLPIDEDQKNYYMGKWVKVTPDSDKLQLKFYFMHLSKEQMIKFVDIFNEGKMNFDVPGYFYTMPYFMQKATVN